MSIVIITGSNGLIGSESVNFFSSKGFDIIGIDNNLRKYVFRNRIGDHIWYITNNNKFKKDYPNWKQKYNTKKIIEELIYTTGL